MIGREVVISVVVVGDVCDVVRVVVVAVGVTRLDVTVELVDVRELKTAFWAGENGQRRSDHRKLGTF